MIVTTPPSRDTAHECPEDFARFQPAGAGSVGLPPAATTLAAGADEWVDVLAPLLAQLAQGESRVAPASGKADAQAALDELIARLTAELQKRGDPIPRREGSA